MDILVENHGTLYLLRPVSSTADEWLRDVTDGTWFGGALVVEPRYVRDIVDGAVGSGLACQGRMR